MINKINVNEKVKINKILVPTDGSPASIKGIVHAVQMAKEKNAEVIALHVDTTFSDSDPKGYTALTYWEKSQKKKVTTTNLNIKNILDKYYDDIGKPNSLLQGEMGLKVASSVGEQQGVKIKTIIERGRDVEIILKIAEQESVDMIVIGAKGLSSFDRILLGSVASKVSQLATCPVLIIKA